MTRLTTRFRFLDTLRGFAIAGILLVNIKDITRYGGEVLNPTLAQAPIQQGLNYLVGGRFVPIFELMFGASLAFIAASARRRGKRPAATLLLRLVALFAIGVAHTLVYPGEVLKPYAIVGLLCLPLVVWAPRWVLLALGVAGTGVAYGMFGGGVAGTPGLFLLGAAAVMFGVPERLERPNWIVWLATGALAVATVPALLAQASVPGDPRFSDEGSLAGGVMALLYIGVLALLFASPAQRLLCAFFEPLGCMALTNYVTASFIVVPIGLQLDWAHQTDLLPTMLTAVGVLVVQSVLSRVWLACFRYGPIEWVWRCITWWELVPLRRVSTAPDRGIRCGLSDHVVSQDNLTTRYTGLRG
ncbi:MAG: DUF418 domain-containing protein [Propionibacteriaceae bacterium]|nr:DUF418 domain-containing protein [Propionibacteriaceae bacterium]